MKSLTIIKHVRMISQNQSNLPLNHQTLMNLPSSFVHHHLLPHFHLPRSLLLALVQVDALGEQIVCGGQGNSDHPPTPSHVRVVTCGALGRGGVLNMPSSWHEGSVRIGYLHEERDWKKICSSFSSTSWYVPQPWHYTS